MFVRQLRLNNFRNYASLLLELDRGLNIIVGKNGIGKTNIIESIIVVSNTRSFRTVNDRDLIKKEEDYARIELYSEKEKYRVVISKTGKSLFTDGNLIRKTSDFIGRLNAVLFKPSDLELFSQSPKERRRLLDLEIGKVSKSYLTALLSYNRLLKDKNQLLKQEKIDEILLNLIDERMVPEIDMIIREREAFFTFINERISEIYRQISGTEKTITLIYKKCTERELIKEMIEKSKEKDSIFRYATFGPHHDDYGFRMDGYELNSIASQGQKRMSLIAFKFALVEYIRHNTGEVPVVLLDDILSELDTENAARLLQYLPKDAQTVITDTDIRNIRIDIPYREIHLKEDQNG